jgi:hypothetical protein
MINVPILGQRDPRWCNIPLGWGDGSIGNYGCLLTSLTSLAGRYNVAEANNLFKANDVFAYNLVLWANVPKAFKSLEFVYRYYYYDNAKVADYVYNKKIPVVVEVDAAPIGSPRSSHFVLFLGDQKCLDPWVGQLRSTSDFPLRKGFALYNYVTPPVIPLTCDQKLSKIREILDSATLGDAQKVIDSRKYL